MAAPLPARIRGRCGVHPAALTDHTVLLDAAGRHRWPPIAPRARVEVALERPALRWSGTGYFDTNAGDGPLEDAFTLWDWSRAPLRDGTAILYDVARRDGGATTVALRVGRSGAVEAFDPPPLVSLPRTRWRIARETRADADGSASVARTLEDAPFYARSVLRTQLLGERDRGDAREPRPRPLRARHGCRRCCRSGSRAHCGECRTGGRHRPI